MAPAPDAKIAAIVRLSQRQSSSGNMDAKEASEIFGSASREKPTQKFLAKACQLRCP